MIGSIARRAGAVPRRAWWLALLVLAIVPMLALAALVLRAERTLDVTLKLDYVAGDITAAQHQALIDASEWKISGNYAPWISIPGLTADWGKCGFLGWSCLIDRRESVELREEQIRRDGNTLRFSLPNSVRTTFKLTALSIRLPSPGIDAREHALEQTFSLDNEHARYVRGPVVFIANRFQLGGDMTLSSGRRFHSDIPCPAGEYCWYHADSAKPYRFPPRHRFYAYHRSHLFPSAGRSLAEPLPSPLSGREIYRANMFTTTVDGRRIDYVEIASRGRKPTCHGDSLEYEVIYVEGEAISFSRRLPDDDAATCEEHSVSLAWDNDGRLTNSSRARFGWINGGSHVTYADWQLFCTTIDPKAAMACNTPPADDAAQRAARADATRVRDWFMRGKTVLGAR